MQSQDWSRGLDRMASVAMILAASVLLWVVLADRGSQSLSGGDGVEELEVAQVAEPPRGASVRGNPAARVAIIEFSDFECPFCGRYARDVYPRLAEDYVNTGKVQYVFRHYPLDNHPRAVKAAEAVECAAGEGKYWEMHDLLFEANGALTEADLLGYAALLDLPIADFEACLGTNAMAEQVMDDRRQGEELGVTATPTFFFAEVLEDGSLRLLAKLRGARSYSVFQSTLDDLLSSAAAMRAG